MDILKKKLIGALIGLARATDGNEHLISENATAVIRDCLASVVSDESGFRNQMAQIEAVKRGMVPDCFLCANPCGRNAAFDLDALKEERTDIQSIKYQLLDAICGPAVHQIEEHLLYETLIVIGIENFSPDALQQLLEKIRSL